MSQWTRFWAFSRNRQVRVGVAWRSCIWRSPTSATSSASSASATLLTNVANLAKSPAAVAARSLASRAALLALFLNRVGADGRGRAAVCDLWQRWRASIWGPGRCDDGRTSVACR